MAVEFKDISGIITDSPFTDNQLRAVTEDGNMIVSAGAGSGKTTVMIARIINKLVARRAAGRHAYSNVHARFGGRHAS